jgi:hypothetical protein
VAVEATGMTDPFHSVPDLEITIGKRINSKVYRAELERFDARNLILHVPGFDPLHFVDLLKGTPVSLRVPMNGTFAFARTKLAKHFKNSSPYVVVRRPDDLVPIVRSGRVTAACNVVIEYEPIIPAIVKLDALEREGWGELMLFGIPEPFDVGTTLRLSWDGEDGKPVAIEVHVATIGRDPEDEESYAAAVRISQLTDDQKGALLRLLLRPDTPEAERD